MNREQAKEQAMVWLDIAKKVIGRKDTQTCLMYAQVYATLATVDEHESVQSVRPGAETMDELSQQIKSRYNLEGD